MYLNGGRWVTDYYSMCKLDNGQIIKIVFSEEWSNNKYYYEIYLVVMTKRKSEDDTTLKSTGKIGIKGLLWAKQKIKEFEKFIKTEKTAPITIYCRWDDNRRRNVYAYGLKNLGYNYNMVFGSKALCKTLLN